MTATAKRAFVVGLAGTPGAGKTALVKLLLGRYPQAQAVAYDRFDPGMSDEQIQDWVQRGGDPNELPLADLIGALKGLTQARPGVAPPLVLFETAFGRLHRASGAFIDLSVWIDTPLDLALSRACLVFLAGAARNGAPDAASDFVVWLTRYMQGYPMLRAQYQAVSEKAKATCDLVLDGTAPPEVLAGNVQAALAARGIELGRH